MYTVYVLYSIGHDKIYIGYTSDISSRVLSHNALSTKGYTLRFRPWELFYWEAYESKSEAIKREKQLKTARGRFFIWDKIREVYKKH